MIERFTKVSGNTLTIYHTMATLNPYTVVEMRSQFTIVQPSDFSLAFAQPTMTLKFCPGLAVTINTVFGSPCSSCRHIPPRA